MTKPYIIVTIIFLIFSGCSLPKTEPVTSEMNKYWEFYKAENYDSLKRFYIPKGDNPDEGFNNLAEALHKLHAGYGTVNQIELIVKSSAINTEYGENIELTYQVSHKDKLIEHQFRFIKKGEGPFKILDHSFTQ